MTGFDGNDHQLEVGHMLGLRWFTLSAVEHAIQRTYEPLDVQAFGDMSPVMYPSMPTDYRCKCGYRSVKPPFPPDHPEGGMIPELRGSRGNWYPGENEATCLSGRFASGGVISAAGGRGGGGGAAAQINWAHGYAAGGGGGGGGGGAGGSGGGGGTVWAGNGGSFATAGAAYSASRAQRPHQAPDRGCSCGFWAYWSLGSVQVSEPAVVGLIKGYGRYEWGERGFRCGHAKILAIHLPHYDQAAALAIEDRYQVDVYSNFLAMLEMFRDKTPAGQPPLTDDYFRHSKRSHQASVTTMRQLRAFAVACGGCGHQRCAPGQDLCASCQAYGVPVPPPAPAPAFMEGREALKRAHAMREKWAKESERLVEASVSLSASAERATAQLKSLTDAIRYIENKYGRPPAGLPPRGLPPRQYGRPQDGRRY